MIQFNKKIQNNNGKKDINENKYLLVNFSKNIKENTNFQEKNIPKKISKKSIDKLNNNNDDNNKKEINQMKRKEEYINEKEEILDNKNELDESELRNPNGIYKTEGNNKVNIMKNYSNDINLNNEVNDNLHNIINYDKNSDINDNLDMNISHNLKKVKFNQILMKKREEKKGMTLMNLFYKYQKKN